MASQAYKKDYIVRQMTYDTNSHRDSNAYYASNMLTPVQLQSTMSWLFGKEKNYPLSSMLLGDQKGGKKPSAIKENRYEYPVMGKTTKTCKITKTNSASNLGIGGTTFDLFFEDNWIKRFQVIMSNNQTQARVQKDLEQQSDGTWKATCVLIGNDATAVLPAADATLGARWIPLYTPVSLERSRGSESNSVTYGKVQNQVGYLRKEMSWGDRRNLDRVMEVELIDEQGKSTGKNWMSWFMWEFEKQWQSELEHMLWYSKYNYDNKTGKITLRDYLTNEVIPMGAGFFQQIVNYDQYTDLTFNKIFSAVSDAFYGHEDSDGKMITLMTGKGGMREFDKAVRAEGYEVLGDFSMIADKFVKGEGSNLVLDGYFSAFYHIDGYYIQVKENPIFDKGRVADVSEKHATSGLPLESYRMVFCDTSTVDGEMNLKFVQHETTGVPIGYEHSVVLGSTDAPKDLMSGSSVVNSGAPAQRAHLINEGSYVRACSAGLQLVRPNLSLMLECIKSKN